MTPELKKMADIRVQDEQGNIHVFPDGTSPEDIANAMSVKPPQTATPDVPWYKKTPQQFLLERADKMRQQAQAQQYGAISSVDVGAPATQPEARSSTPPPGKPDSQTPVSQPQNGKPFLREAWDWVANKPILDSLLPEGGKTSDILQAGIYEHLTGKSYVPGVSDFKTTAVPGTDDTPAKAALRTFMARSLNDTVDTAAGVGAQGVTQAYSAAADPNQSASAAHQKQVQQGQNQQSEAPPSLAEIRAYIRTQADAYGIPPAIALATAGQESSFKIDAKGGKGEVGLFQIMPSNANMELKDASGKSFKLDLEKARDQWKYNIMAGLALLKEDYDFAVANAPKDVERATYAHYNAPKHWWQYQTVPKGKVASHVNDWMVHYKKESGD